MGFFVRGHTAVEAGAHTGVAIPEDRHAGLRTGRICRKAMLHEGAWPLLLGYDVNGINPAENQGLTSSRMYRAAMP